MLKVASQYSGIRSYTYALDRLGITYTSVFACDFDKSCKQTCLSNGYKSTWLDDAFSVDWKNDVGYSDLFIASPPCQPYSSLGKRLGKRDSRSKTFYPTYEYIKHHRPRFFIIENVPRINEGNNKHFFDNWLTLFGKERKVNLFAPIQKGLGYYLKYKVLDAKDYGIPQSRKRMFLIGFRDKSDFLKFRFPKPMPLKHFLSNFLDDQVDSKYHATEKMKAWVTKNCEHQNYNILSNRTIDKQGLARVKQLMKSLESNGNAPYNQNRVYSPNALCPTITTAKGGRTQIKILVSRSHGFKKTGFHRLLCPTITSSAFQHNMAILQSGTIRFITPNECRRLMGFPENFIQPNSDSVAYGQYGNAIVVNVLTAILDKLLN